MKDNVQELYGKIQFFLNKDNNDIGDLAVWLAESYIPNTNVDSDNTINGVMEEASEAVSSNDEEKPKKKIPNKPIKTSKEQKLLDKDRTNLFSKRAGVDKIKFETIVKDIQGGIQKHDEDIDSMFPSYDDESSDMHDFNDNPLSNYEMHEVAGLFEDAGSNKTDFSEIEKLHKVEQLAHTGSVGMIRRST